jgi:hypothetical protein
MTTIVKRQRREHTKARRRGNLIERPVSLVVSDAYHHLTLLQTKMFVRTDRDGSGDGPTYSGDIELKWAKVVLKHPEHAAKDLVGALIASDEALSRGRIGWVVQSQPETKSRDVIIEQAEKESLKRTMERT